MDAIATTKTLPVHGGYIATIDAADFARELIFHRASGHEIAIRICDYSWCMVGTGRWLYPTTHTTRGKINWTIPLHRLVMQAQTGQYVDHIDGNTLNATRANLRIATNRQNIRNMAIRERGTSKYKGVYLRDDGKWRAQIGVDGKRFNLGNFDDEETAALAYDVAARNRFGAFARTNFPLPPKIQQQLFGVT